jgi:serine/threonine-protein kinase
MARFWSRRPAAATRTTEERVEAASPGRPTIWPWLLLLLALVLGALAISWYFANRGDTVDAAKVPDLVGLKRAQAEQRLEDDGFESEIAQAASRRPPGTVLAQRPEPGTLYGKNGIVVLTVARGALTAAVPDVTGLPSARALARLRAAGLEPRAQTVVSRKPAGRVLRQIPVAGTEVPKGSAAVLIVSGGQQRAGVPDVVGLTAEQATTELTRAGFRTQINREQSTEPEGTVIAQAPRAGVKLARGGVVRIDVSQGQGQTTTTVVTTTAPAGRATVPDTVGQDEPTATSMLEGAGFRTRVVEETVADPSQDGLVLRQSPNGGATARTGTPVTITVGHLR